MSRYIKDTNDNWRLSSGMAPIDGELDSTSENPVQNKVIVSELNKKLPNYTNGTSDWDTVPTQNSTKPVTSGAVYTAIQGKANSADLGTAASKNFTTSVTSGSADVVTSGAVYSYIDTMITSALNAGY